MLLVAVGELAELSDCQSLLLNVVLGEQARLACHKLLNGCRYHQVINVVVGASRLPFLWGDNLEEQQWTLKRMSQNNQTISTINTDLSFV